MTTHEEIPQSPSGEVHEKPREEPGLPTGRTAPVLSDLRYSLAVLVLVATGPLLLATSPNALDVPALRWVLLALGSLALLTVVTFRVKGARDATRNGRGGDGVGQE